MNPLLTRCEQLARAGRHIAAVHVRQLAETTLEARITLQDWATGNDLLAGDGGTIAMTIRERLPDVVWIIDDATVEMIEDWIVELARAGEAIDWAKFERAGYRSWLTKPNKWIRTDLRPKPK